MQIKQYSTETPMGQWGNQKGNLKVPQDILQGKHNVQYQWNA